MSGDNNGDILTRVAIPRSGSFLNTGGLSRYKSKTARRSYYDKMEGNAARGSGGEGGGGGRGRAGLGGGSGGGGG